MQRIVPYELDRSRQGLISDIRDFFFSFRAILVENDLMQRCLDRETLRSAPTRRLQGFGA